MVCLYICDFAVFSALHDQLASLDRPCTADALFLWGSWTSCYFIAHSSGVRNIMVNCSSICVYKSVMLARSYRNTAFTCAYLSREHFTFSRIITSTAIAHLSHFRSVCYYNCYPLAEPTVLMRQRTLILFSSIRFNQVLLSLLSTTLK